MVKNLPFNARDVSSIPGQGTAIDPTCHSATKPHTATKTQNSQKEYLKKETENPCKSNNLPVVRKLRGGSFYI